MDRATGILGKLKRLLDATESKKEPMKEEKELVISG